MRPKPRVIAMSRSQTTLTAVLLTLATLTGCDQVTDLLEQGAEVAAEAANDAANGAANAAADAAGAALSEDDKLGMKLSGYIDCINGPSSSVLDSASRYFQWVDREKGLTGKERNVYGLYDHDLHTTCVEGIAKSNDADPDDPELEKAATAWLDAYKAVQPLIHDAYGYYDEEDYKDDDFAKGKEMHDGLVKAFDAFREADLALRNVVAAKNDALQERRLAQLEKDEGRKLRFQQANLMAKAKVLMAATEAPSFEALDLPKLEKALEAYSAALDETEKYVKANEAEADTVMMFDSFVSEAGDFRKTAKELMRRKRDNKGFSKSELRKIGTSAGWMVDGSPDKLNRDYNDLVNRSNGLSWTRYNPAGG
jgi:hypothetical protein